MRCVRSRRKREIGNASAVELHPIALPLHPDLICVPLAQRARWDASWCLKIVDSSGLMDASAIRLSKRIDLHFEPEVHPDERGVVVVLTIGIWKTHENAGVVVRFP